MPISTKNKDIFQNISNSLISRTPKFRTNQCKIFNLKLSSFQKLISQRTFKKVLL